MRSAILIATVALSALGARSASAGCLNPCRLTLEPVTVEPPLACATLSARAQECDCAARFELKNLRCEETVEACGFGGAEDCLTAGPNATAWREVRLSGEGEKELTFAVTDTAGAHTAVTRARYSPTGSGCSVASPGAGAPAVLLGLGLACLGLRRRRQHARPTQG